MKNVRIKFIAAAAMVGMFAMALAASSVQAQQCNVPRQSVSTAAIAQQLAAQNLVQAQATRSAQATVVAAPRPQSFVQAVQAPAATLIVPPPQIVQLPPQLALQAQPVLLASAPGAVTATATSAGANQVAKRGPILRKLFPPTAVSGTRRNGTTFARARG